MHPLVRPSSIPLALAPLAARTVVASHPATPLAPGSQVRLRTRAPGAPWQRGVLLPAGPDSIAPSTGGQGAAARLALAERSRLDVASGRRRYGKRGALIGAGVGATVGLAVGAG
jgi:hypothetical protein